MFRHLIHGISYGNLNPVSGVDIRFRLIIR
jgi:hypothetical protein